MAEAPRVAAVKPRSSLDQELKGNPQLLRVLNETPKESHVHAKKEPYPKRATNQQHDCPTRFKIESAIEKTSSSTSQEHKHPARLKGKSKTDNLSNAVLSADTEKLEELMHLHLGKDEKTWTNSFFNELGGLTQGVRENEGTDCMKIINHSDVPKEKNTSFNRIVCSIRPQKVESYRTRMTTGEISSTMMELPKYQQHILKQRNFLLSSALSNLEEKFMTTGIKNST